VKQYDCGTDPPERFRGMKDLNVWKLMLTLCHQTAGDVSENEKEARTRLAGALEKAKGTYHNLEGKTREAAKATDRAIRSHPYESIGVAFGIGLLIGVLVARK